MTDQELDHYIQENGGNLRDALIAALTQLGELKTAGFVCTLEGVPFDNNPKSVEAWLYQAGIHKFVWAKSALAQMDADESTKVVENLQDAVAWFANWDETTEGGDYWRELFSTIGNMNL